MLPALVNRWFESGRLDLTGQLHNLSTRLRNLLDLPLKLSGPPPEDTERCTGPVFRQRPYELVRDAIIHELDTESSGLRLVEIRQRVERRLDEPVAPKRFKDYVNDQSRGTRPLLERMGYGRYRLRQMGPANALLVINITTQLARGPGSRPLGRSRDSWLVANHELLVRPLLTVRQYFGVLFAGEILLS